MAGWDVTIDALLASLDGRVVVRGRAASDDAEAAGLQVARQVLDGGGRELLPS